MQHYSLHNEKELLQKIAEGDEQSFRIIYDRYRRKAFSYTLRLTESEDMADDLVQDLFLKIWLKRASLPQVENFNAWLHTMIHNLVYDAFKKLSLYKTTTAQLVDMMPVSVEDTEAWLLNKENEAWLQDAIKQLTPAQQQVYNLSRKQGLKIDEIATELNISVGTAKKHLSNSLVALRIYIDKHNMILAIIAAEAVVHCV